jgi:DNA processing protein
MGYSATARAMRPMHSSRYTPPAHFEWVTVQELLAGTPRGDIDKPQMTLLEQISSEPTASGGLRVFVTGNTALLKRPCVSVIGTRKVSREGASRARQVARDIALAGVVVVSGLAEGVDTEAMTCAISHGGKVVGVIGTPLDKAYPAKNSELQEDVYEHHLLVSQFPSGSHVWPSNFPQRNRLMAVLSDATVVIEASDTSGTLHQAAECVRLGRWLFIAKSVAEDPNLKWPRSFLGKPKTGVLERTGDILQALHL